MKTLATLAIAMMVSTAALAQDAELVKARSVLINPDNQSVMQTQVTTRMFDPAPLGAEQTFVRQEDGEAAPIGLVGEPYPPGIEQQPGGIGSDYVAQAKADRAVAQANVCPQPTAEDDPRLCNPQATTAAIKEDALAAKDAAVLSAHAEAKPKGTRTRKH